LRIEQIQVEASDGAVLDVHRTVNDDVADESPAVIVCHGFVQNRLAFESETRSMLAHLRDAGFVVYVVELRGREAPVVRFGTALVRPRTSAAALTAHGLHEYSDVDAAAVVDAVRARGHHRIGWIGHSMGGLVGALLPPRQRDLVDAVATIGAPLFAGPASLHKIVPGEAAVKAARAAHARGFVFEGRRWSGILFAMRRLLDVPAFPAPLRIWAPGSLDKQELAFTLKRSFADDSWAVFADMIELVVTDGERAGQIAAGRRLRDFDRPLLVVAGEADDLAPPLGARPLFSRAGSRDKQYLLTSAGHIDLLLGDNAPHDVWDPIVRFLQRSLR
jgi:pimeloyl-ACP methyl ester carboxylesterase